MGLWLEGTKRYVNNIITRVTVIHVGRKGEQILEKDQKSSTGSFVGGYCNGKVMLLALSDGQGSNGLGSVCIAGCLTLVRGFCSGE